MIVLQTDQRQLACFSRVLECRAVDADGPRRDHRPSPMGPPSFTYGTTVLHLWDHPTSPALPCPVIALAALSSPTAGIKCHHCFTRGHHQHTDPGCCVPSRHVATTCKPGSSTGRCLPLGPTGAPSRASAAMVTVGAEKGGGCAGHVSLAGGGGTFS